MRFFSLMIQILLFLYVLSLIFYNSGIILNANAKQESDNNKNYNCIKFNSITRQILISCSTKPVFLSDIYKKIHNFLFQFFNSLKSCKKVTKIVQ